jgi:diguanylate cyclase (GGDEF)-like protein
MNEPTQSNSADIWYDEGYAQIIEDILYIEDVWDKLLYAQKKWDAESFKTMPAITHSLMDSAEIFGLPNVSRRARAMEIFLISILQGSTQPSFTQSTEISSLLEGIVNEFVGKSRQILLTQPIAPRAESVSPFDQESRVVLLVDPDPESAQDLTGQLNNFRYTVRTCARFADVQAIAASSEVAAIILDVSLSDSAPVDATAIAQVQAGRNKFIPFILISERDELSARLDAVRAGAAAYFTKPLDHSALIDRLDQLTTQIVPDPFRILIVDDSRTMTLYLSKHLEAAGMTTASVTDPLQAMQPLNDFKPDLILMDLYMPGCNGLELASIIRQQKNYVSIPIVFLSREVQLARQIEAISTGGDDFLTKPIQVHHLISSVTARVQRARILRSLVVRDSLTGLLNHTATKEALRSVLARAQREKLPLAYALIDIDKFKVINDSFGHPIGDRVIISLARLLQQRLRKSDIIGRYGGEEFSIILPETDETTASKLLDEIRQKFGQVRHQAENVEFYSTFSGGVAGFPNFKEPVEITISADKALYEAKHAGRNRIVIANA